jgi:hypothetical protein
VKSYSINRCAFIVCILLSMAGAARCSDTNVSSDVNDANGPTIALSYIAGSSQKNPFASFMYFVPLTSLTLVDVETSADNRQQVGIVSYERRVSSKTFYVSCEFEMTGKGFHKYTFDAGEIIATHSAGLKKGQALENVIDYIKFEGDGLGQIEVKGTIAGSTQTVTKVDLKFNAIGRKSPVTLGIYDVEPKDGQYKYENRSGEIIARVDTFIFKKSDELRMGIKVASINKAAKPNGIFGGIKGTIANWFISPPKVAKIGNDTMLDFGYALLKEKPAFTFPKAKNIRETTTAH